MKICAIESLFIWSEQLKTITGRPTALPKSFVVYVLPVPAGPAGAPPITRLRACVKVIIHLSVKGVITRRRVFPTYS